MTTLSIVAIGPGASVQDLGRPGWIARGLSRGGAADRLALIEGAILLGQPPDCAALELPAGGKFSVDAPARIALTGAPCPARLDGRTLPWNASHVLPPGQTLQIGPPRSGAYAYLHVGGGLAVPPALGSRAAHLTIGLGTQPKAGDALPLGDDPGGPTDRVLPSPDRFGGGALRLLPGVHTHLFTEADRARFEAATFTRDPRGNRQGVRLTHDGTPYGIRDQLSLASEIVLPGDVQMTGEGEPYILGPECQTTGGYPRIGTVIPADLPRALQAPPGSQLRFTFTDHAAAEAAHVPEKTLIERLRRELRPLTRDPTQMQDLLSYQLISGVTDAGGPE